MKNLASIFDGFQYVMILQARSFGRLGSLRMTFSDRRNSSMTRDFTLMMFCCLTLALSSRLHAEDRPISPEEMQAVFDEVKTPHKYGVLLRPEKGQYLDCPNVFRYGDAWYMIYVAITDKVGYETCLAKSENLLDWQPLGKILPFAS